MNTNSLPVIWESQDMLTVYYYCSIWSLDSSNLLNNRLFFVANSAIDKRCVTLCMRVAAAELTRVYRR